ncbi:MAG: hypothetical protein JXB62_19010 [Pirellulales bacterium]|nr:hypothetical protein [Pirellulales bacterium]
MQYEHTQHGLWHLVVFGAAGVLFAAAWFAREDPLAWIALTTAGGLMTVLAFAFMWLSVRDEVDCLAVRFGPLPLLGKRLRYADVTAAERDRTTLLDGWGIHWVPGRGWIYNIWGFDCVKLTLGRKVIRIGTDDADRLLELLRSRVRLPQRHERTFA